MTAFTLPLPSPSIVFAISFAVAIALAANTIAKNKEESQIVNDSYHRALSKPPLSKCVIFGKGASLKWDIASVASRSLSWYGNTCLKKWYLGLKMLLSRLSYIRTKYDLSNIFGGVGVTPGETKYTFKMLLKYLQGDEYFYTLPCSTATGTTFCIISVHFCNNIGAKATTTNIAPPTANTTHTS